MAREGLCHISSKEDNKDTVRVELDLGDSGLQYTPGDALGIYPTNCPEVGRRWQPKRYSGLQHWKGPAALQGFITSNALEMCPVNCLDMVCAEPRSLVVHGPAALTGARRFTT